VLTLSENLPAVSVAIDTRAAVERALPDVLRVAEHGLISLERAQLAAGADIARLELPTGAVKLTLYGGRAARSAGQTGYVAAVDLLRRCGAAGATVLLGVDGTLHGTRRRARFFARNANVPLMLLAIGEPDALAPALDELPRLLDEPVATVEQVQICKLDGKVLAEPNVVPEQDSSGLPIWQKLMIHAPHPVHRELVHRLKEVGAAGATALQAVRGFHGDRDPLADSLLSLRRNAPVVVVAVDRPGDVRRWWPVVDAATREAGVVTSELVPASHAFAGADRPTLDLASTPTIERPD
jgi:PII-like signaling protein